MSAERERSSRCAHIPYVKPSSQFWQCFSPPLITIFIAPLLESELFFFKFTGISALSALLGCCFFAPLIWKSIKSLCSMNIRDVVVTHHHHKRSKASAQCHSFYYFTRLLIRFHAGWMLNSRSNKSIQFRNSQLRLERVKWGNSRACNN